MNELKNAEGTSEQITAGDLRERIIRLTSRRRLSVEELVTALDFNESDTLSAVRELIHDGFLSLIVITYPWGVEFELQTGEQSRNIRYQDLGPAVAGSAQVNPNMIVPDQDGRPLAELEEV